MVRSQRAGVRKTQCCCRPQGSLQSVHAEAGPLFKAWSQVKLLRCPAAQDSQVGGGQQALSPGRPGLSGPQVQAQVSLS